VIVLVLGLSLFIATRDHDKDADSTPELFQTMPREGEILFPQKDIRLPSLVNTQNLRQAPVIIAGSGRVVMEGVSVGRIDDILENDESVIPELSEKLGKLKRNFRLLFPRREFPGNTILQCDRGVPGRAVAKILLTCYVSGYRKIQIVTGGILKVATAVFGAYVRYRPEAVPFEMTKHPDGNFIDLPDKEEFRKWASKVDEAAASGKVRVKVSLAGSEASPGHK
jgi:hypothetical protein